ncbi:DUF7848 domain-containing protein [Streptomyces sp. NPDC001732]
MTVHRYRFVQWALRPDMEPDAPPAVHRFRCLALDDRDEECGARSAAFADVGEAQEWAFGHWRAHPEHTGFVEVVERPWVMWMDGPA